MSSHLVPLLFSNWWENLEEPHRMLDQNFGTGIYPSDLLEWSSLLEPAYERRRRSFYPTTAIYSRPWRNPASRVKSGTSTVKDNKDQFQVILDVQQFQPDEVSVKVVDRHVIVEAKHEEKQDDHGWISRQFKRTYMIPDQCDIDQVASNLSSDGVLSIIVPRKPEVKNQNERTIKIECTGKPAIVEKQQQKEDKGSKDDSKSCKK